MGHRLGFRKIGYLFPGWHCYIGIVAGQKVEKYAIFSLLYLLFYFRTHWSPQCFASRVNHLRPYNVATYRRSSFSSLLYSYCSLPAMIYLLAMQGPFRWVQLIALRNPYAYRTLGLLIPQITEDIAQKVLQSLPLWPAHGVYQSVLQGIISPKLVIIERTFDLFSFSNLPGTLLFWSEILGIVLPVCPRNMVPRFPLALSSRSILIPAARRLLLRLIEKKASYGHVGKI